MKSASACGAAALLGVALAAAVSGAQAQDAGDYYAGKSVVIAVGGTAGSGLDVGARLVSRHIGQHLPGKPAVRVELMPGAGGVRLLEHLHSVAAKDGTYLGAFATGPIIEPLISERNARYKTSDFTAVGALEQDVSFCVTWHASPAKTIEDARAREVTVAGTGAASSTDIFPVVMNAVMGTRFRVISGYVGTQETLLALERGETDGRCGWSWSSIKSSKANWVTEKKLNFLVQLGLRKNPAAPDAPLVMDLIRDEADRQLMRVLVAPQAITRPYLAPPGLPAARAADVRKAFALAVADEGFRAEFTKIVGEPPSPTSGEDMQKILDEIYATPPEVVSRLKAVLSKMK